MYIYLTLSNPIIDEPEQVLVHVRPGVLESRLAHSRIRLLWAYAAKGATFKIKREKR